MKSDLTGYNKAMRADSGHAILPPASKAGVMSLQQQVSLQACEGQSMSGSATSTVDRANDDTASVESYHSAMTAPTMGSDDVIQQLHVSRRFENPLFASHDIAI